MDKEKIAGKIEALQKEAQARVNALAQADPVYMNLQGQMGAWNTILGEIKEEAPKPEKVGK
jgi:hypothetical protein